MAHAAHARVLPADLSALPFVKAWRARALMIAVLFTVVAIVLAFLDGSLDHVYRAWIVGLTLTFGFSCGGLLLLMLQYHSGGKMGLVVATALRGHEPDAAVGLRLLAGDGIHVEAALHVGQPGQMADDNPGRSDHAMATGSDQARHRVEAPDAERGHLLGRGAGLLCAVGLLYVAAERNEHRVRDKHAGQYHRLIGSRSSRISRASASWSTR